MAADSPHPRGEPCVGLGIVSVASSMYGARRRKICHGAAWSTSEGCVSCSCHFTESFKLTIAQQQQQAVVTRATLTTSCELAPRSVKPYALYFSMNECHNSYGDEDMSACPLVCVCVSLANRLVWCR